MKHMLPFSFRPPWWAAALAAAGCAAGIALGNWQSERAEQKRAAAATQEPVSLQGEFVGTSTVLLDNKIYRGRPGYHIVQALRVAQSDRHVLVNRGWVPAMERRESLPTFMTPSRPVSVTGVRRERFPQAYAPPGTSPGGLVRQNITVQEFAAWSGLTLEPYVLEQHSALDDGLVRDWPRVESGAEKNDAYALQWYGLAALSLALFILLNLKIGKPTS